MLELFSPIHLVRAGAYDPSQLGLYPQYALGFLLVATLVESLARSGERFVAQVKGLPLLRFQLVTWARLTLLYLACGLVMHAALVLGFRLSLGVEESLRWLGLAVLPRVYTVYGLIPYLGRTLGRLLDLWTLLLVYLALDRGFSIESWKVGVVWACGILAYFLLERGWHAVWPASRADAEVSIV